MDEAQRTRILDDLRGLFRGELLFDELTRTLYSTDASIFQIEPLGVAVPRDEEDVQALVRYAAEHRLPLIPRGAGTGLAGESLGPGILVDLTQHLRDVLDVGADTVRVQPGVVYQELKRRLAEVGRRFAPDPTSGVQCTIGGMLATNASGAHALRHGYTRDHVARLRVVFDNGDAAPLGREARHAPRPAERGTRLEEILFQVETLLDLRADLIQTHRPRTPFNRCGYLLHDVQTPDSVDMPRLLIGSEGTLAIFTEATLRTLPLPGGRALVLLGFESIDAALRASRDALPSGPAACELIDRRLATLALSPRGRRSTPDPATLVPAGVEAVLLVEYEADSLAEAKDAAQRLADRLHRTERRALYAHTAFAEEEIEALWGVRETVLPSLYGLRGGAQPVAFVEDVGVPVEELPGFLVRVQDILQRQETTASFLIHAGTGQVHTRPFLDLQKPEDLARLWALAEEIHGLALGLGGTVSTQHGTGLARTPWVARQYGQLYSVFRELKAIFDPQELFNPGKIIGPDPGRPAWPLRRPLPQPKNGETVGPSTPFLVLPSSGSPRAEAASCNGCGHCRTEAHELRMCPIFRATRDERATPRAKANLFRHLLGDGVEPRLFSSEEVREVADLCVNCRMCASECPARVNVPKLMLEAKAANVAEHGLSRGDWTFAHTEGFAALGSTLAFLANAGLGNRLVRWLLEKTLGVSRKRRLPRFAGRSFLRRAARRGWTRPPQGSPASAGRVAYFVDIFANYNDPELAEAVVAVLHHNGVEVYVPPGQRGCGMEALACGDVETAREIAAHNLRILAEPAREGYPILCAEPTAALMLHEDYPDLIDDPDARLVAGQVVEFTAFLWDLHSAGRLRTDFRQLDLSVAHHVPCHLKALGRTPAGPELLALIPGLRVHTIDVGCSGMAGTFGLQEANYELSLAAGGPMLEVLRGPRGLVGATECSSCRMQMQDAGGKRTLHPAQYLALAYGLMPALAKRLQRPLRGLVLQ
jgi:FAD/FMN-containing dehydrogenase/Fe-S oxidoreductase